MSFSKSGPISVIEFFDAFKSVWELRQHGRSLTGKGLSSTWIGIAVSGGVDSMALAYLCSALQRYEPAKRLYQLRFKPLIVNHKARRQNEIEVERVQRRLSSMGFSPWVLNIRWPSGVVPLELPDFESQARKLRYQALGSACRDAGNGTLFLAHHMDDQAETVLMRLASGHLGEGLKGIERLGQVPECWGLHGVHNSGRLDYLIARIQHIEGTQQSRELSPAHSQNLKNMLKWYQNLKNLNEAGPPIESGGIRVLRPLLSFSKERLIDTCQANNLKWDEDGTNKEVWRTPRNAIRQLLSSNRLPQALRKESILGLGMRVKSAFEDHKSRAVEVFYGACKVLRLDIRSGILIVRLPKFKVEQEETCHQNSRRMSSCRLIARLIVKRMADSVSPVENISLQNLSYSLCNSIFPELENKDDKRNDKMSSPSFTLGGVQFTRLYFPLSHLKDVRRPHTDRWGLLCDADFDHEYVWKLNRQPYSAARPTIEILPLNRGSGVNLPPKSLRIGYVQVSRRPLWSSWQLWDGRYWIRVLNRLPRPIKLRPLESSDIRSIRSRLPRQRWSELCELLKVTAPGNVRYTLLAIAECSDGDDEVGKVLALPSLGSAGIIDVDDKKGQKLVEWEIRYKSIGHLGFSNAELTEKGFIQTWNDASPI